MMKLDNTIKVMVPTKDNDGKAIDYMAWVQKVTEFIGGSTMYDAKGLWVDGGQLYKDSNKLVEFNTDDSHMYNSVIEVMVYLVGPLLDEGGQLAVWLQVNGTTFILDKVNAEELDEVTSVLAKEVQ